MIYAQFSLFIPLKNKKERAWTIKFFEEKPSEFWLPSQIDRVIGLSHEFSAQGILLYADEGGSIEHAIHVLKRFLVDSGTSKKSIGMSYRLIGDTAGSLFDGGALAVTRTKHGCSVKSINLRDWMSRHLK
jgi:hypothetical protein